MARFEQDVQGVAVEGRLDNSLQAIDEFDGAVRLRALHLDERVWQAVDQRIRGSACHEVAAVHQREFVAVDRLVKIVGGDQDRGSLPCQLNVGVPPWQQDADDADDADDDEEDDAPPVRRSKASKSSKRSSARSEDAEEDAMKSDGTYGDQGYMARSFRCGDIHKSLISGRNGERVAEVVEASRELATMVNVFGSYLEQLSKQVDQVRRDQYNTATVLADAVNTVVKSQAALALGLERMAKSATVLAEQGADPMLKSMGNNRPNPGVVMNGRVLTEGAALRRSNAMVDETGHALVASGTVESKLTKSLMGSIIQQSVVDGEFSAKEALRWLTETDSPASGPVAVFRQLPSKLQDRISRKVEEEN